MTFDLLNNPWQHSMLIRVLLDNEEEALFNADCLVGGLLQAVRQRLGLKPDDAIDMCTTNGQVKKLYLHLRENGAQFFTFKELCIVIRLEGPDSNPSYTPVLPEYCKNETLLSALNQQGRSGRKKSSIPVIKQKVVERPPSTKSRASGAKSKKR